MWNGIIVEGGKIIVYECVIRDLAAQILDELDHTGGAAYAELHPEI
jgi:hypothetical protein